jgi:hypothetical protein
MHDKNVALANFSGAMVNHTWCSGDPWIYGLSILTQLPLLVKDQAPFHPTPTGQAHLAGIVEPEVRLLLPGATPP